MKPAPFKYFAPTTLEEALTRLAEYGDEAKILAGGQSLLPTMNFRLAQPALIVDLNRVPGLDAVRPDRGGNAGWAIVGLWAAVSVSVNARELGLHPRSACVF